MRAELGECGGRVDSGLLGEDFEPGDGAAGVEGRAGPGDEERAGRAVASGEVDGLGDGGGERSQTAERGGLRCAEAGGVAGDVLDAEGAGVKRAEAGVRNERDERAVAGDRGRREQGGDVLGRGGGVGVSGGQRCGGARDSTEIRSGTCSEATAQRLAYNGRTMSPRFPSAFPDDEPSDWDSDAVPVEAIRVLREVALVVLDHAVADEDVRAVVFERFSREEIVEAVEVAGAYLAERGLLGTETPYEYRLTE